MAYPPDKATPSPLTYICKCGWVGDIFQMEKQTYNCPKCGRFETVRVLVLMYRDPVIQMTGV